MCPLDKFGRLYVGETERSKRPLNALKASIERYIEIRENWLEGGKKIFGWRGSFGKGKIFFNRGKTERNLGTMREIITVIDNQRIAGVVKIEEIERLKMQLTSGGQGRKLIETFQETALSEDSAYLPTSAGLETSIYIKKDTVFSRGKTLGKGAYGKASRFASPGGKTVVVKDMLGEHTTRKELETEVALFGEVYDLLGKPFFGDDSESRILRHASKASPHAKITLPEVPGTNLRSYCERHPSYDEDELFYAVFNFLEKLHKRLYIAHQDGHGGNIMVLDRLYNVFFIDYGLAYKYNDPTGHNRNKKADFFTGIRQDITFAVYNIFELRAVRGFNDNLSARELIARFRLDRWLGWGFRNSGSYTLESHLLQKINPLMEHCNIRARLRR